MTSSAQKRANLEAIRQTVEMFSPGGDIRGLHAFAVRESGLNHYVSSRGEADRKGAIKAFARNRKKFEAAGNPWLDDTAAWYKSLGLYQHMVPNHIHRWDIVAHPNVLRHPVVSTVVAGRLWNRAIERGAKNLCDMRSLWARGHLGGDPDYDRRCESTRKRLVALGYSPTVARLPLSSFRLDGFGTKPSEDQYEKLWALSTNLGLPVQPENAPEHWTLRSGDSSPGGGGSPGGGDSGPPPGELEPGPGGRGPLIAGALGLLALLTALVSRGRKR